MRFRDIDDEIDYYGSAVAAGFPAAMEELTEAERRREREREARRGRGDEDERDRDGFRW